MSNKSTNRNVGGGPQTFQNISEMSFSLNHGGGPINAADKNIEISIKIKNMGPNFENQEFQIPMASPMG